MRVHVRYFASLRELLGANESIEVPAGCDVGALRALLRERSASHAQVLGPGRAVRMAIDQRMADEATLLHEGAEVAFFPPVTGG
jgi:sulfur-carrier protein